METYNLANQQKLTVNELTDEQRELNLINLELANWRIFCRNNFDPSNGCFERVMQDGAILTIRHPSGGPDKVIISTSKVEIRIKVGTPTSDIYKALIRRFPEEDFDLSGLEGL